MLTLKRCREVLGADAPGDESQLERIRSDLCELSQLFIALLTQGDSRTWVEANGLPCTDEKSHANRLMPAFESLCAALGEDGAYELAERAAIMEYDGGLGKHDAEVAALEDWLSVTEH